MEHLKAFIVCVKMFKGKLLLLAVATSSLLMFMPVCHFDVDWLVWMVQKKFLFLTYLYIGFFVSSGCLVVFTGLGLSIICL